VFSNQPTAVLERDRRPYAEGDEGAHADGEGDDDLEDSVPRLADDVLPVIVIVEDSEEGVHGPYVRGTETKALTGRNAIALCSDRQNDASRRVR
jgi:hypothetical protein